MGEELTKGKEAVKRKCVSHFLLCQNTNDSRLCEVPTLVKSSAPYSLIKSRCTDSVEDVKSIL